MLDNIKSSYILKQVFQYIKNKVYLKLIINNKTLQKKLNVTIDTYIQYSNQIEIEICFDINRYCIGEYDCNKIYHIKNENEKKFYQLYIDKNEIENVEKNSNGKCKLKLLIDSGIKSISKLFYRCRCVEEIKFIKFNRADFIDYSYMFYGCDQLINLDISKLKTDNVNDMSHMFKKCNKLQKLDLSNFNTDNVIKMNNMFDRCNSLKELNISTFNTNNVKDMSYMFKCCESLMKLDLSNFNTNKVKDMTKLFYGCSSLKELNISNFIFSISTNIKYMFGECSEELKKYIRNIFNNLDNIIFEENKDFLETID